MSLHFLSLSATIFVTGERDGSSLFLTPALFSRSIREALVGLFFQKRWSGSSRASSFFLVEIPAQQPV